LHGERPVLFVDGLVKIYAAFPIPESDRPALASLAKHDDIWFAHPTTPTAEDRNAFLEAEVVLGAFPADLLTQARKLRWIQFTSVGLDGVRNLDWGAVAGRVTCTNIRGILAEPMAQTVLGGLLVLLRGIDQFVRLQGARDWQKPYYHPRLKYLDSAHVLLLGAGSVNARLRELLSQFHCTFTEYGRTSGDIHTAAELDDALPAADIICAALPETPETINLLDAARIARFKPGLLFANVGRGSLVDEPALIAALKAAKIGGAVLDVTRREPLPPDDPLWDCPRTILTQHTCAGSDRVFRDTIQFFGQNLARYRAGQPLQNVIDWSKGY
jgi:phosphoglycerate dehydrogenase-like enzyme